MKKIAIVCHDYKFSGANLSLVDWLKDFKKDDYSLLVILPRFDKDYVHLLKECGVDEVMISHMFVLVKKLYQVDLKTKVKDMIKKIYAILFHPFFFYLTIHQLKKKNVSLIHTNSFSTTLGVRMAQKLNVPHIFHIREFMEEDHQIEHYHKEKDQSYCQYSSAIFISDVIKEKYLKKFSFKDYCVLYNKIQYDVTYMKKRKFLEDGILKMILVGTVSQNKGHMDAIYCMKRLNEEKIPAHLYICGTGPYEAYLKKYVEKENILNISFLGYRKDSIELRKEMDISLMCSSNEALGRVTVEAMYYENLVIGACAGCTPYLVTNGETGFLYEKEKEDDLFFKVLYATQHIEECEKIIQNARNEALTRFNRGIADDIKKIYQTLLKGDSND